MTDFNEVSELGAKHGADAAASLRGVHEALVAQGCRVSTARLERAATNVGSTTSFASLERLIAPERILSEVEDSQHVSVRRLHTLRNAIALVPLLLTWLSLAAATFFYSRQLAADPQLVTQPFVALWEDGFGGAPILTFSQIAIADAVLIAMVLGLTYRVNAVEREAGRRTSELATKLDAAMISLELAIEEHAARLPVTAEEWAAHAQRIIDNAVLQTRDFAEAGKRVVESAVAAVESAHTKGDEFIKSLAEETTGLIKTLREDNERFVRETAEAATTVLREAVAADRALVNERMAPLVADFQAAVREFRQDHGRHQESTARFVEVVANLGKATDVLAGSARSYTDIAASIDKHLTTIEGSQDTFIHRVTASADSMVTASGAMERMSTLLHDNLRRDLERITSNVNTASGHLAAVDGNLATTTGELAKAAAELRRASKELTRAEARGWLRRPFSRRAV